MTTLQHKGPMEVIVIGLEPGEMLLESIKEAIQENDIQNGVIVSGIGTLKTCQWHCTTRSDFPPSDEFYTIEKPLELLSISGVVADGEPHPHVVVSHKDKEVYAGHLANDSEVLYLAEVVILKFNDLKMTRHFDENRKIPLLGPKE